jgi:hypothetical protein
MVLETFAIQMDQDNIAYYTPQYCCFITPPPCTTYRYIGLANLKIKNSKTVHRKYGQGARDIGQW